MNEYKYTINGNKYEVVISDITDNIATLTVNGEQYTVEMEKQAARSRSLWFVRFQRMPVRAAHLLLLVLPPAQPSRPRCPA